jgi:hypothetical protein
MKVSTAIHSDSAERSTGKYLRQYAEIEAHTLPPHFGPFGYALVIPAYNESPALLTRLDTLFAQTPSLLVILVVNRPAGSHIDRALPDALQRRYRLQGSRDTLSWFAAQGDGCLLLVDRFSPGHSIPAKQGVGLARKIGCDIACQLLSRRQLTCPWIFSSDADVIWPEDYFRRASQGDNANFSATYSALNYPFAHQPLEGLAPLATQLYEFSLHYYVLGLTWAGSPYAHHSLGSTLAIDYRHYARVRGFPKRAAGEDFYLLNKLAKSGPIKVLAQPDLLIMDRASARTPFGTGVARDRISQLSSPLQDYPLYNPRCFVHLKQWLQCQAELAQTPGQSLSHWHQRLDNMTLDDASPWIGIVADMGAAEALEHAARQSRDEAGFARHMQQWFDAFRTLKFIHALRDGPYPSAGLTQLLNDAQTAAILPQLPALPSDSNEQVNWLRHSNALLADQLFA